MSTSVTATQQATLDALISTLGSDGVLPASEVAQRQSSWIDPAPLQALTLLRPRTTAEVAAALAICHAAHQPVIVYGGGTNLVRATESTPGDILLSLERMAGIIDI
ncbi:MAG: FAD-binding oxidoreductase, partial [Caldilineaceae bacterium]|nr:FAD-binding oxidoreductase [Caldilineaceae bacterium]